MVEPKHLSIKEFVNNGTYYTSDKMVSIVKNMIKKIITKKAVIIDTSAGCGSFPNLKIDLNNKFIFADIDRFACEYMKNNLKLKNVIQINSLLNVSRESFGIKESDELIIVGNPPYNDWTSKSKQNIKNGLNIEIDSDLRARDLGVSFLRSYNKLKANYVCVLHPLSYLIKETNFNSLKEFKNNYRLIDSYIISSGEFSNTRSTKFPILIGLYQRNNQGMTFDYIKDFNFIVDNNKTFRMNKYITTDKFIRKYSPILSDRKKSEINLYFYPYRDINSLKTSKTFIVSKEDSSDKYIVVNLENFYKYSYLEVFKNFFPENFVYGNLSPLLLEDFNYNSPMLNEVIYYSLFFNKEIKTKLPNSIKEEIIKFYKINIKHIDENKIEKMFTKTFKKLIEEW